LVSDDEFARRDDERFKTPCVVVVLLL